jgi:acetyl-CoA carboxylase carboxyl transferase subunit alpha
MLQYSIYSVISPEGCASILWKSADKAPLAAEAMGVSAQQIFKLGLVDQVLLEPLGGAHRNYDEIAATLKKSLLAQLSEVQGFSVPQMLEQRYKRLMAYGL